MKKSDGFTLIELVVGILATTLVSGAIMTFLLMGLKANRATIDANTDQRNAKIMITMMEKLASEGSIDRVESVGSGSNLDWTVFTCSSVDEDDPDEKTYDSILSYTAAGNVIRGRDGTVMMDGVLSSTIEIVEGPLTGCLLQFSLETTAGTYETSVFCRTEEIANDGTTIDVDSDANGLTLTTTNNGATSLTKEISAAEARLKFLSSLIDQVGSEGMINDGSNTPFSLWYCREKGYSGYPSGWNENTPWCACFVSWAAAQLPDTCLTETPCEANVDELWKAISTKQTVSPESPPYGMLPGDLIFFDWNGGSTESKTDLEHVGVVLFTENGFVYTIEGNSGGIVALRRYSINDPSIYGYGILNWSTNS